MIKIFIEKRAWLTTGKDTQYTIEETDDEYIIAFYGSNSKTDWRTNFNFFRKPYKHMEVPFYVHRGFLAEWKRINDFFLDLVKSVSKPITVVGHSYGGAIATLCMEDIWFNYPEKRVDLKLVTFGAPRVIGWYNYRKIEERWANATLYSNTFDSVSHVPFFLMGFRHVKKLTVVGKSKSLKEKLQLTNNHTVDAYDYQINISEK